MPFFKHIKPYSHERNNMENAKETYYFMIEFMRRIMSSKMVSDFLGRNI